MDMLWKFEALDTLFFRDSRPMNAGETVWIESTFPPTGQTLQGAVRTAILNHLSVCYKDFLDTKNHVYDRLRRIIGDGDSLGRLDFSGPFLFRQNAPLFPAPLDLFKRSQGSGQDGDDYTLARPCSKIIKSDLGSLMFPSVAEDQTGYKPVSGCFVDSAGMEQLLAGKTPPTIKQHLFALFPENSGEKALAYREPKMGLARDNLTRKTQEGKLFAISAVRMDPAVALGVEVNGLAPKLKPHGAFIQKLGGEGKMAAVSIAGRLILPPAAMAQSRDRIRFKLVCITPALMPKERWLPHESFQKEIVGGQHVWRGKLNSSEFNIVSACIGKPWLQGGWNHARRYPKDLCAYVPAGSVYFCEADLLQKKTIENLHGAKIGRRCEYGFGQVLVGCW